MNEPESDTERWALELHKLTTTFDATAARLTWDRACEIEIQVMAALNHPDHWHTLGMFGEVLQSLKDRAREYL